MAPVAEPSKRVAPLETIRSCFPALERRHEGYPVAYFDGPGGTQVPRSVVDAVADYLLRHNANTHWGYPTSAETDAIIAGARQALADFLNASPAEIAFGANMTTLTFQLSRALGRGYGPGDEIVVTELDHHANIAPWRALERERGVTVRTVALRPGTAALDRDDLARQINGRTRLVAIGAASNAVGTINDVAEAGHLAHQVGALLFVDAVHYAPHRLVDVAEWDCDFLACSAYKFYGPHIGVLYGRRRLLEALDVPKLDVAPETAPDRFETGTQNHEGIAGAGAAVDFLASLGDGTTRRARLEAVYETLHDRATDLVARLWAGLESVPGIRIEGPPPRDPRTPTVSFHLREMPSAEVSRRLVECGLYASHGHFYARTLVDRLCGGRDGLVRIGCACYTTAGEIDRLIEAVRDIAS